MSKFYFCQTIGGKIEFSVPASNFCHPEYVLIKWLGSQNRIFGPEDRIFGHRNDFLVPKSGLGDFGMSFQGLGSGMVFGSRFCPILAGFWAPKIKENGARDRPFSGTCFRGRVSKAPEPFFDDFWPCAGAVKRRFQMQNLMFSCSSWTQPFCKKAGRRCADECENRHENPSKIDEKSSPGGAKIIFLEGLFQQVFGQRFGLHFGIILGLSLIHI